MSEGTDTDFSRAHDRQTAPQSDENSPELRSLLIQANLLRIRGKFPEASEQCAKALTIRPTHQAAHSLLGDICRDQGHLEEAIRWYRMAVDLNPNPVDEGRLALAEQDYAQHHHSVNANPASLRPVQEDELNVGTGQLLGMPPQTWIRGLWAVSISFLAIFLIALAVSHESNHKRPPVIKDQPNIRSTYSSPAQTSSSIPATPSVVTPSPPSGSGFAPDNSPRSNPPNPQTQPPSTAYALRPAPIHSVNPLPAQAPSTMVQAPSEAASPPQSAAPNLTGGILFQKEIDNGNGEVALFLWAPSNYLYDTSSLALNNLVHNAYAVSVYAIGEQYSDASVIIQTTDPKSSKTIAIFEGVLDKQTALSLYQDTNNLTEQLKGFKNLYWIGPIPSTAPSTSTQKGS